MRGYSQSFKGNILFLCLALGVHSPKKQGNEEKKQNSSPVGELF